MQREKRGILTAIEAYIDMLVNLGAILLGYIFAVTVNVRGHRLNVFHPYALTLIFLNLLALSFFYRVMDLYRSDRYSSAYEARASVLQANSLYFGFAAVITLILANEGYRLLFAFWLFFSYLFSSLFLILKRCIIRLIFRFLRSSGRLMRRVIVVGDNADAAAEYIREVCLNPYSLTGVLGCVGDKINSAVQDVKKLGKLCEFEKILDKHRPTHVVFSIESYDKNRLLGLINMCDGRCIKVYFLPVLYGFFKNSGQIEQVGSLPLLNIHATPLDNLANAQLKRIVDIVGSVLLIVFTAPIMLFAAVGVRLSSPGPILFKQKRVGRLGREFNMLKFRSMRVNTESDIAWTTDTDPRKTRFGTFLRRTAIDELPQFFNVLSGSMSLVGPRPEIPALVNRFKNTIPLYMIKHYVKPGITGLAQIKGLRGDTSVEARIREDLEYIENWSLSLDLAILLKTPFKAFNKNEKYVNPTERERG